VAAATLLGGLELAVSAMVVGFVAGPAPGEDEVDRVKRQVIDLALRGLR
jgi:hypothetical protein